MDRKALMKNALKTADRAKGDGKKPPRVVNTADSLVKRKNTSVTSPPTKKSKTQSAGGGVEGESGDLGDKSSETHPEVALSTTPSASNPVRMNPSGGSLEDSNREKYIPSWLASGFVPPMDHERAMKLAQEIGNVPRLANLRKDGSICKYAGIGVIDRAFDSELLLKAKGEITPFNDVLSDVGGSMSELATNLKRLQGRYFDELNRVKARATTLNDEVKVRQANLKAAEAREKELSVKEAAARERIAELEKEKQQLQIAVGELKSKVDAVETEKQSLQLEVEKAGKRAEAETEVVSIEDHQDALANAELMYFDRGQFFILRTLRKQGYLSQPLPEIARLIHSTNGSDLKDQHSEIPYDEGELELLREADPDWEAPELAPGNIVQLLKDLDLAEIEENLLEKVDARTSEDAQPPMANVVQGE